jgi:outer membrane murein-binding lipoprotein Lpp
MNIKDLIDDYVATKNEREELSSKIKDMTAKLGRLEGDIMALMSDAGLSQAASDKASCSMKMTKHPAIKDWQAFTAMSHRQANSNCCISGFPQQPSVSGGKLVRPSPGPKHLRSGNLPFVVNNFLFN